MFRFIMLVSGENPFELLHPYNDYDLFNLEYLKKFHRDDWQLVIPLEKAGEHLDNYYEKIKNDYLEYKKEMNNKKGYDEIIIKYFIEKLEDINTLKDDPQEYFARYTDLISIEEFGGFGFFFNKKAMFDWYSIAGERCEFLKLKNGKLASKAIKSEIDWEWHREEEKYPFGLLTKDEWYDIYGDDCLESSETICSKSREPTDKKNYQNGFWSRLDLLSENTLITVIDCYDD